MSPVSIPDGYTSKGPQPFQPPFTFQAQEALRTGSIVSLGTNERTVKMCDIGEYAIGWAQHSADADAQVDISLFAPVWLVDIDGSSLAISYGDIVEVADDGKVKHASTVSPGNIVGLAIQAGTAGGQVLVIPIPTVPDPST